MKRCALVVLGCLLASTAAGEVSISLQGQLGGESRAVAVSADGELAYIGKGPRVAVLDLLDPDGIRELAESQVLPEVVENVVLVGNFAFVADGNAGLYIMDISNPFVLTVVGHYALPEALTVHRNLHGLGVCVAGKHAYFSDGIGGLHILDVSNPAEPVRIAKFEDVQAYDVVVADRYAYVATSNQGLLVFDVSDPAHPQTIGRFETSRAFTEVEVLNGYVYAVGEGDAPSYNWGLYVVDVRDPSNPALAGRCDLDYSGGLAVDGKIAYVTNGWQGVEFIRITNPSSPAWIGRYDTEGFALTVVVRPGRLYVAADVSGLEVVDISNLAKPVAAGTFLVMGGYDVAVSDDYAYMASTYTGLHVVDVSDPCMPWEVSSLDLDYASCVCVGKSCVWIGDGPRFTAIDVSNPRRPKLTGACETSGWIEDIEVQGSYAYAASGGDLTVLDISDACKPAVVSKCELSTLVRGVCVRGTYAYVTGVDGLDIIDISDPAAPAPMGRYNEPGDWPFDVALHGDYAYLAHGNVGMRVIDISDPWLPGRIRQFDTDFAQDIVIQGDYAYLTDLRLGVQVFDVSSPVALTRLGGCGYAAFQKIAVSGDYIYAADWSHGLTILKAGK